MQFTHSYLIAILHNNAKFGIRIVSMFDKLSTILWSLQIKPTAK